MLSYRHAFHAGNHADVLKHMVLVELVRYLAQKDKPFWVIDTHAGAGMYELGSGFSAKLAEYREGIGRLWGLPDPPPLLAAYLERVRDCNPNGSLRLYPGSPWLALQGLRAQDRLRLFELHPSDAQLLERNFAGEKRVTVATQDGLSGLKGLLPPAPRRALILIDPPYELQNEYRQVVHALRDALERFPTGLFALWYPQLARTESQQLPDKLKRLPAKHWLHVALSVRHPSGNGIGMHGSGLFVINQPWTLHDALRTALPEITARLAQDDGARFVVEQQID